MTKRGKWLVGGAGLIGLAWSGLQLFLTHRLAAAYYDRSIGGCARFVHERPGATCYPLHPVALGDWLPYAATSIAILLALAATATLLVRGRRRWWALLVTAMPAANLLWGWQDWRPLGTGWMQLSGSPTTWIVAGIITDTAVVGVIALAIVFAISPTDRPAGRPSPALATLGRAVPPVVVLTGWWLMRHPLPDQVDRIWLAQATAFVLAAALLATCRLSPRTRALVVLVVLPLTALPVYTEATGFGSLSIVLHAAALAAGTAVYVLGAPALRRQLQLRNKDGSASNAPTSAMT
jgi:hypothetical protein